MWSWCFPLPQFLPVGNDEGQEEAQKRSWRFPMGHSEPVGDDDGLAAAQRWAWRFPLQSLAEVGDDPVGAERRGVEREGGKIAGERQLADVCQGE